MRNCFLTMQNPIPFNILNKLLNIFNVKTRERNLFVPILTFNNTSNSVAQDVIIY